jgi:hypothetical protein
MKTVAIVMLLSAAATSARAGQEDPLRTARDLYASTAYEEALSELTRVRSGAAAAREADAYRAFCLVALGRNSEAEAVAEALVRTDPTVAVDLREASPRIVELFARVRRRILPQLIRDEYRTARALAAQQAPDADSHLVQVQRMLADAEKAGAWDDTLADLRVLVDGFLEFVARGRTGHLLGSREGGAAAGRAAAGAVAGCAAHLRRWRLRSHRPHRVVSAAAAGPRHAP